jgi:hypothetical protein
MSRVLSGLPVVAISAAMTLASTSSVLGGPQAARSASTGPSVGKVAPARVSTDLAWSPPAVEAATIQALERETPAGNAVLEVRFERDKRLGRTVPIYPDGERVLLRDDGQGGDAKAGDGVFSAVVKFDFKELSEQAAVAARQMEKPAPQLIFRGRQVVGIEDEKLLHERLERAAALRDVDKVVRTRMKFDLDVLVSTVSTASVDPERSLVVTAPDVVADPTRTVNPCTGAGNASGKWTFKHLVTEMTAGTGIDPADFTEKWLKLWLTSQPIAGGFSAAPRPEMATKVLDVWPRVGGKLDLDRTPFRLAAIVNRIDLGNNPVYGGGSAGEGRFVFGVWDRAANSCNLMPFSVIFEYAIPRSGCHSIREWAKSWVALSSLALGSPQYNAALEAITEEFAKAGASSAKPNGSALSQLRTNENALKQLWELREFRISSRSHLLFEDTTKQTPDETLNGTTTLGAYINANAAKILQDKHTVPLQEPAGSPFLATSARASGSQLDTHFEGRNVANNDARFHLSLNACTACHIRETGTTDPSSTTNNAFLHVDPRSMPARLSRFMTGATPSIQDSPDFFKVVDAFDAAHQIQPPAIREFNDVDRRRQKLASIAGSNCFRLILVPPLRLIERIPRIPPEGPLPPVDPRLSGLNDPLRMTH